MEHNETKKKSFQTRIKIMDAYIELMKNKDFDSITVKAIVEKANVTRGTFYLYFSDIYEMTSYIEETLLSDMPSPEKYQPVQFDALIPPSYEKCQDNCWEYLWFEYYQRYSEQLNTLLGPHGDISFHKKVKKHLQKCILIRMDSDNMPNDKTRDYFMNILPDLFLLLAREWTSNQHLESLDINNITTIVSTMRVGSLYRRYLDSSMSMKTTNQEVAL